MPGKRSARKAKAADKDWKKLNEGSPLPECEDKEEFPRSNKKKKNRKADEKKQKLKMDSPIPIANDDCEKEDELNDSDLDLCDELLLEGTTSCSNKQHEQNFSSSDGEDDDEIKRASEKLEKLRIKQVKMRKESKLQKIREQTKQLKRAMSSSNNNNNTSRKKDKRPKKVASADLRAMSDVVRKVDKLMDDKKLNFKGSSSDDSSDSSSSNSDGSDSEYEHPRSDEKKKISGKETRITSHVKFPQMWPHSHLKYHFVAKAKKYDELSLSEFCAGYLSILRICKSSYMEPRIAYLEELMNHATTKPWKCILNYHAACLLEIERGNLK